MNSPNPANIQPPETTGKYLVLLREDDVEAGIQTLQDSAGVSNIARASDFEDSAVNLNEVSDTDTVVFDQLGVAVTPLAPEQLQSLNMASANKSSTVLEIEPERVVYAIDLGSDKLGQPLISEATNLSVEYLRGYRDAIVHLVDNLISTEQKTEVTAAAFNEMEATWGLQVTKVMKSRFSGLGVKVAVLDTGLDLTHPDFSGRTITSKSFIPNEEVQDHQGHGTHCIGTACGTRNPLTPPRYGVAYNAEIYVGKVLSNRGSGSDEGILAGIQWAMVNGCRIVSMSLGAATFPGQQHSRIFETVARRALSNGTLIIAAAGNESRRSRNMINSVGHPANCPSIMAVGAIDAQMQIADFSTRGMNFSGGQVDIAGPGVNIHSTWPMPTRYRAISGTSMATPHVAGIAALYAEANPKASAQAIWSLLTRNALRLPLSSVDVGSGLVQAPV